MPALELISRSVCSFAFMLSSPLANVAGPQPQLVPAPWRRSRGASVGIRITGPGTESVTMMSGAYPCTGRRFEHGDGSMPLVFSSAQCVILSRISNAWESNIYFSGK